MTKPTVQQLVEQVRAEYEAGVETYGRILSFHDRADADAAFTFALSALQERVEAAERERDEARATVATLTGALKVADAELEAIVTASIGTFPDKQGYLDFIRLLAENAREHLRAARGSLSPRKVRTEES